jgi:hypothetical protein
MNSGKWIRELREERFVRSSDIERVSRSIADVKRRRQIFTFRTLRWLMSKLELFPAFTSLLA